MTEFSSQWFDRKIDRTGTNSEKWRVREGELPMWVADMDFAIAPAIAEAVQKRAAHPVFGYGYIPHAWYDAYTGWWKNRHGLSVAKEELAFCTGVIPAISSCVRRLSHPAEKVVILTPVYHIFFHCIRNNGRIAYEVPLLYDGRRFDIDWEALEDALADPQTSMLLLCNPHNPAGRIWTKEELLRVGELCDTYRVTVLSDEIHCDITAPEKAYVPFASVSERCAEISVTTISPTKAFNIPGLQTAAVMIHDATLRHRVVRGLNNDEIAEANTFAIDAAVAAFTEGEAWLDGMCAYVEENKRLVREYLEREIPAVTMPESEATYLVLLDVSGLHEENSEVFASKLREQTGLYLSNGVQFGTGGERFVRVNLACPKETVEDGLARLKKYVTSANGKD